MDKYIDHIESYIKNELSREEKENFERELTKNPELQQILKNFPIVKQVITASVEEDAYQAIKGARSKINREKHRLSVGYRVLLRVAASIVLLGAIASLINSNLNYSTPKIVIASYIAPVDFTVYMGPESENKLRQLMAIWDSGDLEQAIDFATSWKSQEPKNMVATYSLAHLYFQKENFTESDKLFTELLLDRRYNKDAEFHAALCQYMLGEQAEAKKILIMISKDSNHPFSKEASQVIEKFDSFWRRLVF